VLFCLIGLDWVGLMRGLGGGEGGFEEWERDRGPGRDLKVCVASSMIK